MAELLLHSVDVPEPARAALERALRGPAAERPDHLMHAASVLARETDLDCSDVRELVGLDAYRCDELTA